MFRFCFKIVVYYVILTLSFTNSYAQESDVLRALRYDIRTSNSDSVKINRLIDLSNYYYELEVNLDSAIIMANKAVILSKKHYYLEALSKSYGNLSTGYLLKNEIDSAHFFNSLSYELAKKFKNPKLEFSALMRFSSYFLKNNNLVKAIDYGIQGAKIAEGLKDESQMAVAYYKLAYAFSYHDDSFKHKYYLDKAYKLACIGDVEVPINVKSGIYASMVDFFEQKRFKNQDNKSLRDSVIYYAEKGIVYGKSVNRVSLLAYLLGSKGKMLFLENKIEQAKSYYLEALKFRERIDHTNILNLYNKLAYVYLKEGNVKQALSYKDSVIQGIDKEPSFYKQGERYNLAYYICKTAKKYDLALQYHEDMVNMFNKAKEEKQIKTLNEIEIKYETQKKDAEIVIQKLENERIKNRAKSNYFILGIVALLSVGVLTFLYFKKQNKILISELNLTKTKVALHRSQLNPHFISNSINAIYPFLYDKTDPNKAAAYLSDLSQMIRGILDSTFETNWTLKEEIRFIEQYCKIQELKMDIPLSLNITSDESIQHILIPSLITQTFIENCFVHGFATQDIPALIKIDIMKQDDELIIRITDNGASKNKYQKGSHTSRSNQIVEQRIKNTYLKNKLSKDFLTYGIVNNKYQVKIKLPIRTL